MAAGSRNTTTIGDSYKPNVIIRLSRRSASHWCQLAKWSLLLAKFDILYIPRKAVKGKALANFLTAHAAKEDVPLNDDLLDEELPKVAWGRHCLDCLSFERIDLDALMSDNEAKELAGRDSECTLKWVHLQVISPKVEKYHPQVVIMFLKTARANDQVIDIAFYVPMKHVVEDGLHGPLICWADIFESQ
ncbi:hypothetical protein ACLOJK_036933 [Asimina triloba]